MHARPRMVLWGTNGTFRASPTAVSPACNCVKYVNGDLENGEKCIIFVCRRERNRDRRFSLFAYTDYQRLTSRLYVHVVPPACTCRKNSKYSRSYRAYFRQRKAYICVPEVPFSARCNQARLLNIHKNATGAPFARMYIFFHFCTRHADAHSAAGQTSQSIKTERGKTISKGEILYLQRFCLFLSKIRGRQRRFRILKGGRPR